MNESQNYLKLINNLILNLMLVIVFSATVGNTIDVLKGSKHPIVSILFLIFGGIMIIYLFSLYRKNPYSLKIKLYAYVGFFLLYTYTIFATKKILVFIYIIPFMFMYILYCDVKLIKYIVLSVMSVNIIRIIWMFVFCGLRDKAIITDYTIQIIALAVMSWNVIMATIILNRLNNNNINKVKEANINQETILKEIYEIDNLLDSYPNLQEFSGVMNKK